MEIDVQQYLDLIIGCFLFGIGLFLVFAQHQQNSCEKDSRPRSRGLANSGEQFQHSKAAPRKYRKIDPTKWVSKGLGFCAMILGIFASFDQFGWIDIKPSEEPAHVKGLKNDSNTTSFPDPLTAGLDYELAGRPELALAVYSEANGDQSITQEAKAFVANRIAEIRFKQGFAEEALQEARFAIELGGPNPLYLHTLAKILIHECHLDDAKEQLRRVKDSNVITEELLASIAGRRVDCQQS